MRWIILAAAVTLGACASIDHGGDDPWSRGATFAPMGSAVGAKAATVAGSQREAGLYTIRVRVERGGSIAPHTHPDDRILTVLAGEVWYGFGETADIANAKLYRTGDVFMVPANKPHFAIAKESFVVYQEAGKGPTAFTPVK